MTCELTPCGRGVVAHCSWGTDNIRQEAEMCQQHVEELFQQLNPLLQTNRVWFTIRPPKENPNGAATC